MPLNTDRLDNQPLFRKGPPEDFECTLKETLAAKICGVFWTSWVRHTPKRAPLRETMIIPDFSMGFPPPPAFARAIPGVIPSLVQTWKFMFVCLTTDFNAARRASKADAHRTGQERWTARCWEGMWMSVALKIVRFLLNFFQGKR